MPTAALRQVFRANGHCRLPTPLPAVDLAMLQGVAETLMQEDTDDGSGTFHTIGRGHDRRFLRHRHGDFPALAAFLLSDAVYEVVSTLLGDRPVLFNEQFVVKGPKTGASFAWHQDGAYVGFDHAPYLTLWIALDDVTEANGCVYIQPRDLDQGMDLAAHRWDDTGKELVGYDGADPGVAMTGPAGTIVAFSSTTLHRSGANSTDHARRAYICQYAAGPIIDPATGKVRNFATPFPQAMARA